MFWPDVIELKSFYASLTGQVACQAVRRRIRAFWPETKGETVLGLGYAVPYLQPILESGDLVIAAMPAGQGVIHWPAQKANLSLLVDEATLPLKDSTVNRVLLIHALEHSEQVRALLQEMHRVLTPSGRMIVVVPNRRGIWARSPNSPFAHGQTFTLGQLKRLMQESRFTPLQHRPALFFPPLRRRFLIRSARVIDLLGEAFFTAFGGVIIMEAEKQVISPIKGKPVKSYQPVRGVASVISSRDG
jgi:SAM-dependent methyltransferase